MSATISEEVLTIAAVGRPFHLGMLYDCRSDKILPGITLWDNKTLEKKSTQKMESADFEIIASDTIDDKASALEVNAGLKLSFLGGLIDISGSGKYLDNRMSSSHQERVTLKYKCTTRSEEMTMEQLGKGKIQHPEVFDHGTATHVVTGITYGGNAFFVFDREISSNSGDKEIHGNLHAIVKKIPGMSIDGYGKVDITENDKKNVHKFSCRYFGDFLPRENPSSFEDAVKLYKEMPKFVGQKDDSVPIMIRLYPLVLLDSKASRLVREISTHLVRNTEGTLENLHEFDIRCNDLLKSEPIQKFKGIRSDIQKFKSLITTYKLGFQKELCKLLPPIRGGGKEEIELVKLLEAKEKTPFGKNALTTWLQTKERQVKILSEYSSSLSEISFASEPGDLESKVLSPKHTHVLCFSILMPVSNPHLEQMSKYIKSEDYVHHTTAIGFESLIPQKNVDDEISMMSKARYFRAFFEANVDNKLTAFLITEESSDSNEFQAKIKCYVNGSLKYEDFEIPSGPQNVHVDAKSIVHDGFILTWDSPSQGISNINHYEIICENLDGSEEAVKQKADKSSSCCTVEGLEPGCAYNVGIRSVCEPGVSHNTRVNEIVKTKPTNTPGKPEVWQISSNTIGLKFTKPSVIGPQCYISDYIIKEKQNNADWCETQLAVSDDLSVTFNGNPGTVYRFKVCCDCGDAGRSLDSEESVAFELKIHPKELLKKKICEKSRLIQTGKLCIYQPEMKRVGLEKDKGLQKFEFGVENEAVNEKTILIVGATGSGKTTMINGMFNYILGVDWKDQFRFKLITEAGSENQAKSQTSMITSYTIHHQEGFSIPYTLTIIDTPGFGDVEGIQRDKEITDQIRKFFTNGGLGGIDHLDAVGFLAQSSLPRLTPTQRYIFDQILSLFGRDIAENIFLLLTFADGQKPQVLSGIKEADMPYKKFFKFNNCALYAGKDDSEDEDDDDEEDGMNLNFDAMFWEMGQKSFQLFLKELLITKSKSLTLTKDVLNERNQLEVTIVGIRMDIQTGLNKLEQLKKEVEVLKAHEADIDRNKNFKYTVSEEKVRKVQIPCGQYITNCLNCNRTCHEVCAIADDSRKAGCWAITNGNCRICPSKCNWQMHKNFPYKFVCEQVQVVKTAEDLRKRYETATQKKTTAESLIGQVREEFNAVQLKVLGMTETVRKSIERLKEIALKPNPLSTVEYIDLLIQSEKHEGRPGWQARSEHLQRVRQEAEYMKKIAAKGYDPFQEYKKKMEEEAKTNKKGMWTEAKAYFSNIFK